MKSCAGKQGETIPLILQWIYKCIVSVDSHGETPGEDFTLADYSCSWTVGISEKTRVAFE